MDTLLIVLIIAILIMIVFLIFINQKTLKKVITYKNSEKELKIGDERYYELNNKIQLMIVVSSIIILIGSFIGYNSITSIKEEVRNDVEHYKISLEEYDKKLSQYDSTLAQNDSIISYYQVIIEQLKLKYLYTYDSLKTTSNEANNLKSALIKLQKEYKLNSKTYIIPKIGVKPYDKNNNDITIRLYFKDLKTSEGKNLPIFKEEPYLSVMGKGIGFIVINKVTADYFEYDVIRLMHFDDITGEKVVEQETISSFGLLIIEGINYSH